MQVTKKFVLIIGINNTIIDLLYCIRTLGCACGCQGNYFASNQNKCNLNHCICRTIVVDIYNFVVHKIVVLMPNYIGIKSLNLQFYCGPLAGIILIA